MPAVADGDLPAGYPLERSGVLDTVPGTTVLRPVPQGE